LRALIVDDEAPARAKLRLLLGAEGDVDVVGEASTGREAVAAIKRSRPDVVFLDIQMPGLDGFAVLETIGVADVPYVVFVTADDTQAIKAFEVGAVDYLLKPFTPTRFEQVVDRARNRLAAPDVAQGPASAAPGFLRRLLVVDNGRALFLAADRIDRVEAERNYVYLHSGGERYRLRATLASIADRLDPAQFLRVNRATVVRLDAVASMTEWAHGDFKVVMKDGTELIWSRRYRAAAERLFSVGG
jgi:two-component system, LytTR family, response regulator